VMVGSVAAPSPAPGLGSWPMLALPGVGDARRRDPLNVSKIRTDFVANLAVSKTDPRKRARRGV